MTYDLNNVPLDTDYYMPSATGGNEKAADVIAQFNRKRKANAIAVPTDDVRVRARLASDKGTRFIILKLAHSNVPSTTINITPTNAASGIISIKLEAKIINASNISAALIPDMHRQ